MGKVFIIGTGPGDEELLTIKASRVLKKCTAVLYDRLVSNNILNYLPEECEVYYCGKEPGDHYKNQDEINQMLVKLAKDGHTVGRIKGGDPYVFGRGGEEVLSLVKENIEFEVIPGVTSPIAVLNYAGIPITQRELSQSIHIVTGMSASQLRVNWKALAKENGTLVFMMGLNNLNKIVSNLIKNGKEVDTPAAVVMRGTSSKQKKVIGNLENIEEKVKEAKLQSPCIIVVGDVVSLNEKLSWYEKKPLFGLNICITRSKEQAKNLKEKLLDLGAEVTEINAIKIRDTSKKLENYIGRINQYNHIIFTSVNAVDKFFDYLIRVNYDVRQVSAKFAVVGNATKKALQRRGVQPFIISKEFIAEDLFREIKSHIKSTDKILLPCSSIARNYLKENLEAIAERVDRVEIYDTVCGEVKSERQFEEVDMILFTSPSTVNNMIEMFGEDKIKDKINIAIGPKTQSVLQERDVESYVCKVHSEEGFLNEVVDLYKIINES